jgi:hypothetical protein
MTRKTGTVPLSLSKSVPGTDVYPLDLIARASRENSMSVFSVPGTEGYVVDKEADGMVE